MKKLLLLIALVAVLPQTFAAVPSHQFQDTATGRQQFPRQQAYKEQRIGTQKRIGAQERIAGQKHKAGQKRTSARSTRANW